jgi:hypothetical protein
MEFPDTCIKGVPNASFVHDGLIGTDLFYFKECDARDDGWVEQSINITAQCRTSRPISGGQCQRRTATYRLKVPILRSNVNWQDDEHAIEFTLNQTKKGTEELHFKAGVAIVPRPEIDRIRERYIQMDILSYERRTLEDNPYHGNILLRVNMIKSPIMKQIAGTLAMYSQYLPRDELDPKQSW